MGGLTSAVHWWEEWQLRVLALVSVLVQFLLLVFSILRAMMAIPRWCRFIMWLAYLAGDAVAIYALATLFNRHKADQDGVGGGSILEVVWAPVLLIHLGGQDGITAFNIEDNELWSRHLLTAVSQVTVAIYVFCKSWPPGGDKRLLTAAILLFIPGVLKCFHKPWALKRASFYSLVTSHSAEKQDETMYTLDEYVEKAKKIVSTVVPVEKKEDHLVEENQDGGEGSWVRRVIKYLRKRVIKEDLRTRGTSSGGPHEIQPTLLVRRAFCMHWGGDHRRRRETREKQVEERGGGHKLFVDLSSPYPLRLRILEHFCGLSEDGAFVSVGGGLSAAFYLLYTKLKTAFLAEEEPSDWGRVKDSCLLWLQLARCTLPWASIALFYSFHRRSQAGDAAAEARLGHHHVPAVDAKITYAMFWITPLLEHYNVVVFFHLLNIDYRRNWSLVVAQYSLVGYFARSRKLGKGMMCIISLFGCTDLVADQHCGCISTIKMWIVRWFGCGGNYPSSDARITKLVLGYLKQGWLQRIRDAASYRRFNDSRGHWALDNANQAAAAGFDGRHLDRSIKEPFDKSVLLWHIATDLCFSSSSSSSRSSSSAAQCSREMSNYMVYLLFANPEMLLPGSRRNLFTAAHEELEHMFQGKQPPLLEQGKLTPEFSNKLKNELLRPAEPASSSLPPGYSIVRDACVIAQELQRIGDDDKMWEVIQGVWVEMLCFSASRCRGYLHAKALGNGGEFLSYVWLLLYHMGMETFTEKLQGEELIVSPQLPSRQEQVNDAAAPSTCSSSEIRMAAQPDGMV